MDVSTDFLRTFIAVCECKGFTRATARVHKSQAAISTQIAKLEEPAGSKFIDRSQRQFKLTKEGEVFLRFAQEMVAKTDAAQHTFSVDFSDDIDRRRLPRQGREGATEARVAAPPHIPTL